ncbi:MAG: DksA/TraR family C4-type zinc finger protein [Pseudomonadota bacterium]
MAGGWSKDGGVQAQIDASIDDAVKRARSQLSSGESLTHCEACDTEIPEARRRAVQGVRLCITCQSAADDSAATATYNRRGSKDSQLR